MNGQQIAEQNYQKFINWLSSKIDPDFKQMIYRGQLSRKEIASECGFGKSAINQNPQIKKALEKLEEQLRLREILPEKVEKINKDLPERDTQGKQNQLNTTRLSRLEQEVSILRAENDNLRKKLIEYKLLDEAILESGRIPRK